MGVGLTHTENFKMGKSYPHRKFDDKVGVGLTHTENLMIKKLKEMRETSELELEGNGRSLTMVVIIRRMITRRQK